IRPDPARQGLAPPPRPAPENNPHGGAASPALPRASASPAHIPAAFPASESAFRRRPRPLRRSAASLPAVAPEPPAPGDPRTRLLPLPGPSRPGRRRAGQRGAAAEASRSGSSSQTPPAGSGGAAPGHAGGSRGSRSDARAARASARASGPAPAPPPARSPAESP